MANIPVMLSPRSVQALVALRRADESALEFIYEELGDMQPYTGDDEQTKRVQDAAAALMEVLDALVEGDLLEPPGHND